MINLQEKNLYYSFLTTVQRWRTPHPVTTLGQPADNMDVTDDIGTNLNKDAVTYMNINRFIMLDNLYIQRYNI